MRVEASATSEGARVKALTTANPRGRLQKGGGELALHDERQQCRDRDADGGAHNEARAGWAHFQREPLPNAYSATSMQESAIQAHV